jgi:predicted ATPase/DNA-binding SARP family transcriptional activator
LEDEVLGVNLLGTFSVAVDGESIPDRAWRLRKAKTLIKLLALEPERRIHADRAAETLWPEHDRGATRNNLHQAIYAARRALDAAGADGRELLELSEDLITLGRADSVRVDVVAFEAAAARARCGDDPAAYRAALTMYEGELLPEDRYEEWTASRREALRELRLGLALELAELEAASDPAAAIEELREVLVAEPLHEPAHRALMRLYAGAGRRQEALAQFQELKRGLEREFADEPDDETRALYREILTRSFGAEEEGEAATSAAAPPEGQAPSLPRQLTSFVGRERELRETAALLGSNRLLTLTGAGGCGKTRLALELARQRGAGPDGEAWVVELAAIGDPALVAPAIAQSLGTRIASGRAPEIALAEHIGERQLLLVLDNCEHLVASVAALVEALLARCPRLTVLATSREVLRVPGEVTWRVPSLSLPALGNAADPRRSEAVRLFAARAAQASPGFELDAGNVAAVAALVHRLDGMPLAIELAAARVGALTPAQIVARLDDSLDLLTAGSRTAMTRQQTLRATLSWSYDLLEEAEQVLLRRLAVFAGDFGVEAVEEICAERDGAESEALLHFGRLIDKSLVQVEGEAGGRRFHLLDTVRQFAAEQLDAAGERDELERCHRHWYAALAASDPTPAGDLPSREWLGVLDLERDNFRAALATALAGEPETGLRLAVSLWGFWLMRGYLAEAYRWLEELLAAAPQRSPERARALLGVALISVRRGVYERTEEFAAESVAILDELGDHCGMFDAVEIWAGFRVITASEAEVEALVGEYEGVAVADLPAQRPAAAAAQIRGIAAWARLDSGRARAQLGAALECLEGMEGERRAVLWPFSYCLMPAEPEFGYPFMLQEDTLLVARRVGAEAAAAYTLVNLATPVWAEGEPARAQELLEDGLARFQALNDRQGEAFALNALGNLARREDDFERGRERLGEALELREAIADRRGNGITLACTALLLARSGDPEAGRAAAARARRWFVANDDLVGLSAAEFSLTGVALAEADTATARAHLEAGVAALASTGSSHQKGWALMALATLCSEEGEPVAARRWLRRARRQFELLEVETGCERCGALERAKELQSGV